MGVDYKWAGSASYPRYYEEMAAVATKVFGAKITDEYQSEQGKPENHTMLNYFIGKAHTKPTRKFEFPEGTPKIVCRFFEEPEEYYDAEETAELWSLVKDNQLVEELSHQLYEELKLDAEYGEGYYVS